MSRDLERNRNEPQSSAATAWLGRKRTTAAALAAVLLVGWGLAGEYLRDREMQREIDRLEARAAEMKTKNQELEATGRTLSSEALLEREARLKMNLRKPGEEVVVVQGVSGQVRTESAASSPATEASNPAKWWRLFFR